MPCEIRYRQLLPLGAIALASLALNLLYLAYGCSLDLAPDEAHYWDWSRRLDWCYYSKGPLVAWSIRASTELFGTNPFTVRLPAALYGAWLLLGLGVLALQSLRSAHLAAATMLAALTLPPFNAVSVLMTIDAPFLACWCWAAVFVQQALITTRWWAWLAAGGCLAMGQLAKQTMLLFPVGVGVYMLCTPRVRPLLRQPGFWGMLLLGSLGHLPQLLWNAAHDWVGWRHLFEMSGVERGGFRWFGPAAFLVEQAGLLLGLWLAAWLLGCYRHFHSTKVDRGLLVYLSLPLWVLFAAFSFFTKGQPNWPAAAYVTGLVLAVATVQEHWNRPQLRRLVLAVACLGLGAGLFLRWPGLGRPVLNAVANPPTPAEPCPVRRLDPTARLAGWSRLAEEVDRCREYLRQSDGYEAPLAGMTWILPGQLGFYCTGRPAVYSFGPVITDRHSQYDIWRPNPIQDAQVFTGKTFVYVGIVPPPSGFERIEKWGDVVHRENGVPLAAWGIWICRGFHGFDAGHDRPARY